MYYDSGTTSPGKREGPGRKKPRRQGGARGPEVRRAAEVRRAEVAARRPEAEVGRGVGTTGSAPGFPVLARGRRKRPAASPPQCGALQTCIAVSGDLIKPGAINP